MVMVVLSGWGLSLDIFNCEWGPSHKAQTMTSRKAFFTDFFPRTFFNVSNKYLIHYLLDYKLPTFEYINYMLVGGAVALRVALTHTYLVHDG